MTQTTNTKPLKRIYAVSKRASDDNRKADWFEIGAEWPTKKEGMTRISQNDGFIALLATGEFDIVTKTVD